MEAQLIWCIVTPADICPSCGQPRPARYCGECGERTPAADELSFSGFIRSLSEEFLPFLDSQDERPLKRMGGRVYRTAYTLIRWPGRLTADYVAGRRRPYMKPIQVYLLVALVFFIFGHNYFQYNLQEYEYVPGLGDTAGLIEAAAAERGLTVAQYQQLFDARLEAHKKTMIALLIPLFALGLVPLYRRQPFGKHLIFATHYFAVVLLFMLVVIRILALLLQVWLRIAPGTAGVLVPFFQSELAVVLAIYLPMATYLYVALRAVYGGGKAAASAKALMLVLWHLFLIVMVFRNGLFFSSYLSLKWFG